EREADRDLGLGEPLVKVFRIVLLQLRQHGVDVEDEDVTPLLELLWIALGQSDALIGVKVCVLAVAEEVAALGRRYHAGPGISLLEIEEVADVLLRPGNLSGQDSGLVPGLLPLVEVAGEGLVEQAQFLVLGNRDL